MEHVQVLHAGHENPVGACSQIGIRAAQGLLVGGIGKASRQVCIRPRVDEQVDAGLLRCPPDDGDAARLLLDPGQRLTAGVLNIYADRPGGEDLPDGFGQLAISEGAVEAGVARFDVGGDGQLR